MRREATRACLDVLGLAIHGPIVPVVWFQRIRRKTPKGEQPALVACLILADIIDWYKPTPIRDEGTGAIIWYQRKFYGMRLQKSASAWGRQFGCSRSAVIDALNLLTDLGLIVQDVKKAAQIGQQLVGNVRFVEPVVEAVRNISQVPLAPNTPLVGIPTSPPSLVEIPTSLVEIPTSLVEIPTTNTLPNTLPTHHPPPIDGQGQNDGTGAGAGARQAKERAGTVDALAYIFDRSNKAAEEPWRNFLVAELPEMALDERRCAWIIATAWNSADRLFTPGNKAQNKNVRRLWLDGARAILAKLHGYDKWPDIVKDLATQHAARGTGWTGPQSMLYLVNGYVSRNPLGEATRPTLDLDPTQNANIIEL